MDLEQEKRLSYFLDKFIPKGHSRTEPACRLIPLVSYAVAVWPKPPHHTTVQRLLYTVLVSVHWGTQYTSSSVAGFRFFSTGEQSSPYFIAASKGSAELYCCTEGKQLAFICSVALIVNRVRCHCACTS